MINNQERATQKIRLDIHCINCGISIGSIYDEIGAKGLGIKLHKNRKAGRLLYCADCKQDYLDRKNPVLGYYEYEGDWIYQDDDDLIEENEFYDEEYEEDSEVENQTILTLMKEKTEPKSSVRLITLLKLFKSGYLKTNEKLKEIEPLEKPSFSNKYGLYRITHEPFLTAVYCDFNLDFFIVKGRCIIFTLKERVRKGDIPVIASFYLTINNRNKFNLRIDMVGYQYAESPFIKVYKELNLDSVYLNLTTFVWMLVNAFDKGNNCSMHTENLQKKF